MFTRIGRTNFAIMINFPASVDLLRSIRISFIGFAAIFSGTVTAERDFKVKLFVAFLLFDHVGIVDGGKE